MLRLRHGDPQTLESAPVEASVTSQQSIALNERMGADQQIRHDSDPRSAAHAPELTPELSRLRGRVIENRLEADTKQFHGFRELRIGLEMSANFSPYDLARHERSSVVRSAQRLPRPLPMNRVGAQNIQKDG